MSLSSISIQRPVLAIVMSIVIIAVSYTHLYDKKKESSSGVSSDLDPMFEDAAKVIVRHQQGSVSLLQRRLKLGYSRAARIVDQLEEAGIVGPNDGSKARSVLVENEEQLETILRNL